MYDTKSKKFFILKSLVTLAIPTVIEEVLSTLLHYVDTAMVGQLGEKATATVSASTTINWLISGFYYAISMSIVAIVSETYGRKNENDIKNISKQIKNITVVSSLITFIFSMIISHHIPYLMGTEESIRKDAILYFIIISLPMYFRNVITIYGAAIRSTTDTKSPMIITVFENIINIILNYILIYVLRMGVIGAAIGTAISYTIAGILMMIIYNRNKYLNVELKLSQFDINLVKKIINIAYPLILTNAMTCIGYTIFASLVSHMGTTIFAAHSIAITAETLFYITGYGFRSATSIMIGISIGEKDYHKFILVEKISIIIVVLIMTFNGIVLFNINESLMSIFTNSEQVIKYGSEVLKLIAITEPIYGLMIVLEGIHYGLGETKTVFKIETFSMYFIRILFTFIVINFLHGNLISVWYCMICDNVTKAFLLFLPIIKNKYKNRF